MDSRTTNRAPSGTSTSHRPEFATALLSDYSQHRWDGPNDVQRIQLVNFTTIHTTTVRLDDVNK